MSIVTLTEWNQFLSGHPNAHLLQTGEWGELKSAFRWKPVRIVTGNVGVQILFRSLPFGFSIAYIPKGPVYLDPLSAVNDLFWKEIDILCKDNRAVFCKLELDFWDIEHLSFHRIYPSLPKLVVDPHHAVLVSSLFKNNWVVSRHNIQPPRTIIIDARGNPNLMLNRMKQKTRYNIRLAEKKEVSVRVWDDIESFHTMMLITGGRDGFGIHSLEYYKRVYELLHPKQMCELLVAQYEGKPLAALFVARNGNRAYYLYGASTDEERNRMPTYLLQWEAMKWARSHGCEEYDLWGIPDEDEETLEANFETRHDGLWGVYRFKRGFGGELKRAAQAMDKVYYPFPYWAYLRFVGNRE